MMILPGLRRLLPVATLCLASILLTGCEPVPKPLDIKTFAGIDFVWIPEGTFQMGCPTAPDDLAARFGGVRAWYFESEQPVHAINITKGFWLSQSEITQDQWKSIMDGANPSEYQGDELPVDSITWTEAQDFVARLSSGKDGTFRLPTEAEWEYACRAGTTADYSFGSDNPSQLKDHAWFWDNSDYKTHAPMGKRPNNWGVYDMTGNVFEWCQDYYSETYYSESPGDDPQGPAEGKYRVRRGGAFAREDFKCRSPFRTWNGPENRLSDTGLRIVRNAD